MIVALYSGTTFMQFLATIGAASVAGTIANVGFIAVVYRRAIFGGEPYTWSAAQLAAVVGGNKGPAAAAVATDTEALSRAVGGSTEPGGPAATVDVRPLVPEAPQRQPQSGGAAANSAMPPTEVAAEWDAPPPTAVPAVAADSAASALPTPPSDESPPLSLWRRRLMLAILALVPVALLVADRWIGLAWMTMLASCALMLADGRAPDAQLHRIDGMLLLFFAGLFVTVAAFNATGVPERVWQAFAPAVSMHSASGVALYCVIILVGSNTVSNVPLTLLLAPKLLETSGQLALIYWTELAYISTIAGNLTLLGSVANLIVAERCKAFYPLTFTEYLWVGAPSTLVLCLLGVPVVRACAMAIMPAS